MKFCLSYIIILAFFCPGCKNAANFEKVRSNFPLFKRSALEINSKKDTLTKINPVGLTLYSNLFSVSPIDSLSGMTNSHLLIQKGLVEFIFVEMDGEICFNISNIDRIGHMNRYYLLYHPSSKGQIGNFVVNGFEIKNEIDLDSVWTYYMVWQAPD